MMQKSSVAIAGRSGRNPRGAAALLILCLGIVAGGSAVGDSSEGPEAPPPAVRLLVFLVDEKGTPRIADALTCPLETRVLHSTGARGSLDYLRYSFTPHRGDPAHHTSLSF